MKDVKELNNLLQHKSYLEGYEPSSADSAAFSELKNAPSSEYQHALRWYNHIKSYSQAERSKWAGASASGGAKPSASKAEDDEEDIDLFGDDDEEDDEEKQRIKEERLKAYAEKKSKKPALIAKSNIILDVKPWDDETDLAALEKQIREIQQDGLLWGASKLVPIAYGIKKLQISCVVEDDKVGTDFLEESITAFEDYVQSVDIAAFNKI